VTHSLLNILEPSETEAWFQRNTPSKMAHGESNGHVSLTSRNPERSNSWSKYAKSPISRK